MRKENSNLPKLANSSFIFKLEKVKVNKVANAPPELKSSGRSAHRIDSFHSSRKKRESFVYVIPMR